MDIRKRDLLAAGLGMGFGLAMAGAAAQQRMGAGAGKPPETVNSGIQPSSVDLNYRPRRFNKAIELWEDGQPVYYATERPMPGVSAYERGKLMCKTYADVINYDVEHVAFDITALAEFMRGLADGGGTRSGHRFPAVFVTCPVLGLSEEYAFANSWIMGQILDTGVSGIQLCHVRDPKAVEVTAHMACRYPFDYPGVPKMRLEGIRGAYANFAAQVWGMNNAHYVRIADLWPLNPKGEIMFGLKIEDTPGDARAAESLAVPGVAFAEWGPTDNNYWLNGFDGLPLDGSRFDPAKFPKLVAIRRKILDLCRQRKIIFLNASSPTPGDFNYVIDQIRDGTMFMPATEETAIMGRDYTKRKMPV